MMTRLQRIGRLTGLACCLLLAGVDPAPAGAPAPAPTAAGGPHLPEHQIANLGDFQFENGAVVRDFKVSYVTYGRLNRARDNAVLVMHHWGGDHHNFDFLIGSGKALDTDKYFIVASDTLGSSKLRQDVTTGPTSSGLRMDFPPYSLRDSVNLEYKLLKEYLGLDRVLAVSGISVGAIKAFQFAVSYPAYARGVIPIAGNAVTNPQTKLLVRSWMATIALDGGWKGGNYETNPATGVATAFMNLNTWVFTPQWFAANMRSPDGWRQWSTGFHDFWSAQDARDIYYQGRSWADFDVGETPGFKGDANTALRSIKAATLIIGFKSDLLFDRAELIQIKNAIPRATHLEIDSPWGHAACCGGDVEAAKIMGREIAAFLAKLR